MWCCFHACSPVVFLWTPSPNPLFPLHFPPADVVTTEIRVCLFGKVTFTGETKSFQKKNCSTDISLIDGCLNRWIKGWDPCALFNSWNHLQGIQLMHVKMPAGGSDFSPSCVRMCTFYSFFPHLLLFTSPPSATALPPCFLKFTLFVWVQAWTSRGAR